MARDTEDYDFDDNSVDDVTDYNNYSDTPTTELKEGQAVMSSFFTLAQKLKKLELKWKGRSLIAGEEKLTHEPIGSDRFVDSIVTSIESIVSQDNSISTIKEENARVILWEKYDAFTRACVKARFRGEFNENSFILLKEEFDHVIELFMGHVINSHGIDSAYKLQGGVIADKIQVNQPKSMLELGSELLRSRN